MLPLYKLTLSHCTGTNYGSKRCFWRRNSTRRWKLSNLRLMPLFSHRKVRFVVRDSQNNRLQIICGEIAENKIVMPYSLNILWTKVLSCFRKKFKIIIYVQFISLHKTRASISFTRRQIKAGFNSRPGDEAHGLHSRSSVYSTVIWFLPGLYSSSVAIHGRRLF